MRKVRFNDIKALNLSVATELRAAYERVFDHQQWVLGEEVVEFEKSWASLLGAPFAVGCSNGTDALVLALRALGVGKGAEVITTSMTFFATVEAILEVGATPVFVDVLPDSGLMDPSLIEAKLSSATRAILAVHLYGQPVDMKALTQIARKHSLFCIEDAAQAHGISHGGKFLGTWGDVGCYSFYPGKNLGALGDAGAVVTAQSEVAKKIQRARDHGRTAKYEHLEAGANRRMSGLQAAFLREKLKKMSEWDARRRAVCEIYQKGLAGLDSLAIPSASFCPKDLGSLHLYVVRHEKRIELSEKLKNAGIETGVHYPLPCHLQPAWRGERSGLAHTERFAATCLSLPLSATMTREDAEYVVEAVRKAVRA